MYLNEYFIHGNMSNASTLLIIYAIIDLTPWYIEFLYCLLVVEEVTDQFKLKIGKLNGDLLKPSGIRYEVWSFSVRHFISIDIGKYWFLESKLSVVVPQAIGIYLHNSREDRWCIRNQEACHRLRCSIPSRRRYHITSFPHPWRGWTGPQWIS